MKSNKVNLERACEKELNEYLLGRFNVGIKDATDDIVLYFSDDSGKKDGESHSECVKTQE